MTLSLSNWIRCSKANKRHSLRRPRNRIGRPDGAMLELFQRSKDLRVALRLTSGWLKKEGLPGFRDGLLVMKGLIERYWDPSPRWIPKMETIRWSG